MKRITGISLSALLLLSAPLQTLTTEAATSGLNTISNVSQPPIEQPEESESLVPDESNEPSESEMPETSLEEDSSQTEEAGTTTNEPETSTEESTNTLGEETSTEATTEDTESSSETEEVISYQIENLAGTYATILSTKLTIFDDLTQAFANQGGLTTTEYYLQTLRLTQLITNQAGEEVYLIADQNNDTIGYTQAESLTQRGAEGEMLELDKPIYVKVTSKSYPSYKDFAWTKYFEPAQLANKKFEVKEYYNHYNTNTYYALFDGPTFYGYINKNATTKVAENEKPQGDYIKFGKYVTVSKSGYNTWQNFSWKQKHANSKVANKTYLAKGKYTHANGSTYYSLYDNNGKWLGYINAKGAKVADGKQGTYISDGSYVTISKKNYDIWSNFSWKKKASSNSYLNQMFIAKGRYVHFNGATYYSLYYPNGKWLGYVNSTPMQRLKKYQELTVRP
ncbi:hypothetical protein [Vagococcus zengguangii]|uniref:hypothetical protein n=1 Tax=Vagococcus zengguangii TaxID=2571750 RepID=UPI0011089B32|nr:hypothetical protein [Vagococcus zengguangii]TLG80931.1 hypothetical protein FE258_03320 [Vagococcus zengguangii]